MERAPLSLQARRVALRSPAVHADASLFATVYQEHHQDLFRYIRSIVRAPGEAEDVLQSVMLKALEALRSEQRDFELRPWLFRIAHNEAINRVRQRRPAVELDAAAHATAAASPCEVISDREQLQQLWADLAQLPERQRQALVLRELSGLSHEEIAAVIGTSGRAVKQTIFEARVALGELAEGRQMDCAEIRRVLSDGDGRVRRRRRLRAHLASCTGCRAFDLALTQRPDDLHALAPALPVASAAALLGHVLHGTTAVKAGTTAAAGGAGATSAAAGGTATTVGGGALGMAVTTKVAIIATTVVAAAGATGIATHHARPVRAVHATPALSSPPAAPHVTTPARPAPASGGTTALTASGRRATAALASSSPGASRSSHASTPTTSRSPGPTTAGTTSHAPVAVAVHPATPSTGSVNAATGSVKNGRLPNNSGHPTATGPAPAKAHPIKAHPTKVHPTKIPAHASHGPTRSAGTHPTRIPAVKAKGPEKSHVSGASGSPAGSPPASDQASMGRTATKTKPSTLPGNNPSVVTSPPAGPATASDAHGPAGEGPPAGSAPGAGAAGGAGKSTPPAAH